MSDKFKAIGIVGRQNQVGKHVRMTNAGLNSYPAKWRKNVIGLALNVSPHGQFTVQWPTQYRKHPESIPCWALEAEERP